MELLPELIKLIQANIPEILTFGLAVLSIILGTKYKKWKTIVFKLIRIFALVEIAVNDDQFTQDEVNALIDEFKELFDFIINYNQCHKINKKI